MKRLVLLVLVFILAACGTATPAAPLTQPPVAATPTRVSAPTLTATPIASPTPAPTVTPTMTPTATPTPTVALPVKVGTPLPPLAPIGGNWGEVKLVGEYVAPYPVREEDQGKYQVRVYGDRVEVWVGEKQVARLPARLNFSGWLGDDVAAGQNRIAILHSNMVTVYDWNGKALRTIAPDKGTIGKIALSPDGQLVAYTLRTGYNILDWWFYVVDIATGKPKFRQHADFRLQFSQNSRYLAVSFDRNLHVYDVKTGKEAYTVWTDWGGDFVLSPSGEQVGIYRDAKGVVEVYEHGRLIRSIHWRAFSPVKPRWAEAFFSPDETLVGVKCGVTWQSPTQIVVFDIATGKRVQRISDCGRWVNVWWQGHRVACQNDSNLPTLNSQANYLTVLQPRVFAWGILGWQHCKVNEGDYTCVWGDDLPREYAMTKAEWRNLDPSCGDTFVVWEDIGRLLWTGCNYPYQYTIRVLGTPLKWAFPEQVWSDGKQQIGVALSPDNSLLALAGKDSTPALYGKPNQITVKYLVLQQGVKRPPAITFEDAMSRGGGLFHLPLAFCGQDYLAVAPSGQIRVYQVATGKEVWEHDLPLDAQGLACGGDVLAALDADGTLWIFGVPLDKAGKNP